MLLCMIYLFKLSATKSPTVLSMMLSLAGAGCIVTNQSFTSIKSNSSNVNDVVQGNTNYSQYKLVVV